MSARTSFRMQPPDLGGREFVLRSSLLAVLAHRHERRLTVISAGPGFGKTTMLAQAVLQNRLAPAGLDIWVTCYPGDADAQVLAGAILEGLDVPSERARHDPVGTIADAVWSRAPSEIAVLLDDFHLIEVGSSGHNLVEQLARALPANGHLVVASRTAAPLSLGRFRAAGDVIEIGEGDLAFDADEQARFAASRHIDPDAFDLRWPALAELAARSGSEHAIEYVWDEVLLTLPQERRRNLARLSHFDDIDDDLVAAVTGSDLTAATLFDGLPLVSASGSGTWRLHDLWRVALDRELTPTEHRDALSAGAHWFLTQERLVEAARAFVEADDRGGLRATAKVATHRPLTATDVDSARQIHALLPTDVRASSVGVLLGAFGQLSSHEMRAVEAFELAAQLARSDGEIDIEARALWLATQLHGLVHGHPAAPHLQPRTAELAETGLAAAQAMRARHQAYVRLVGGEPMRALELLEDLGGFGERLAPMLCDQLFMDAGRPELVGTYRPVTELVQQTAAGQLDLNFALALWMRGDIEPTDAVPIAVDFIDVVDGQRMPHQLVLALSVVTIVAVAAGADDLVQHCIAGIDKLDVSSLGRFASGYLDISHAAVECADGDEAAAQERLGDLVAALPLGRWAPRTYLHALAASYLLVPETRAPFDSMDVGTSLAMLRDVARALVALRDGSGGEVALGPWWGNPTALRSGLWPSHLVELAVGAISGGTAPHNVAEILDAVPHVARHLQVLQRHPNSAVARIARELSATRAAEPTQSLSVRALGTLAIEMDGVPVTDSGWKRRERVRRLFAYLIEHRSIARRRAAAELWPDLEIGKALVNLRVNLSYLQKVLEPNRAEGAPSWFITADDENIQLHEDRMSVDAWRFDALITRARQAADRNVPSEALELFRQAVDLYGGDYLVAWEDEYWGSFERLRYRSLLAQAANRAGELLLARGEPEAALALAGKALRHEPLSERAHRIRIKALLGADDRAGARRSAEVLVAALRDATMRPEPDTEVLLARLGLGSVT